ncbi:MAG: hypothetical protein QF578_08845 [Alphaproteobacteria bacterium]|jgi:hypothetical protein|nr:hypothetical protein [Alphaproteobacteria bacterium]
MAWQEWDYCKFPTDLEEGCKEFIDDAFFQLNFFAWVIDDYFAGRSNSGNSFKKHFNGTIKPKVKVVSTSASWLAHAWPDALGSGTIVFNADYLTCCRDIYNGDHGNYGWANRYGALLEATAVTIHELNHVVWRLGEKRAWSMEGFFRHAVQNHLGIAGETLCGQLSRPCGSSTRGRDGCSLSDLQAHMVDIQDAPDAECRT